MKSYTPSYHTLNKTMNGRILNAIDNVRDDYRGKHSKMFEMRMDVHLPEGTDQSMIMVFNHRFIESQKNKGRAPAYVMVREVNDEGNTHYHMVLFLNGQKVQSTYYCNAPHLSRVTLRKSGKKVCSRGLRESVMPS